MTTNSDGIAKKYTWRDCVPLAGISLLIIYLELIVIRWLSSEVRIFAYFKNFPLLATFLGFGCGCIVATRRRNYFRFAPVLLLAVSAVIALAAKGGYVHIVFTDPFEYYILGEWTLHGHALAEILQGMAIVLGIFVLVTALFATLGEKFGQCFNVVPALVGYGVNVIFSFIGALFYAALTWMQTGPFVWLLIAVLLLLPFFWKSVVHLFILGCVLLLVGVAVPKDVVWSPYYRLSITPAAVTGKDGTRYPAGYTLNVNYDGMQGAYNGSQEFVQSLPPDVRDQLIDFYNVPYRILGQRFAKVVVLGAGAGNDVAAAIRNKASWIDAVEIDPAIIQLGKRFHPERPYNDKKAHIRVADARAFLRDGANSNYDLIVFAALDSHTVFSSMSSLRLDNYVYTIESFRDALRRLAPRGVIAVSFYFYRPFQLERVYNALWEAAGVKPVIVHSLGKYNNNLVMFSGPGADRSLLLANSYVQLHNAENLVGHEGVEPTTDDWPFLFLRKRGFPTGYFSMLVLLVGFAYMAVMRASQLGKSQCDWPMLLLGMGFMLLETKLIAKLALLLSATWVVNTFVISAVLLMIFAANLAVMRGWGRNTQWSITALLVLLFTDWIARLNTVTFSTRPFINLLLVLLLLVLPAFFAGLVFSNLYRTSDVPSLSFGYNLLGAMIGGVMEYSSTWLGINNLNVVSAAIYGALALVLIYRAKAPANLKALGAVSSSVLAK